MLQTLDPASLGLEVARFMPQVLSPLITAAERGEALEPAVSALVRVLGFDSFMYGASVSDRPNSEQKSYVFTTLPRPWVMRYDQRAYIEVDPRIQHVLDSAMPFIWDQRSERGKSAAIDAFLDDAAANGVSSGVAIAVYSALGGRVAVCFNSANPEIDDLRRFEIARNMGDMYLLAIYFHEMFMKTVVARGLPPPSQGAPLSPQEKKCLTFSAHGFTSRSIAAELRISERTVELHFSHVRSKLGVANRQEAIAKAMSDGIVHWGQLPNLEEAPGRAMQIGVRRLHRRK
jgi:DNA-binding CsgD family transcriptional regulator